MKRRWLLVAAGVLALVLVGCEQKEKVEEKVEQPEEAFQAYLADWQSLNYAKMYDRLTPEAQAKITRDDFATRYKKIYDGIEAASLAVVDRTQPPASAEASPTPEAAERTMRYEVSLETQAGPIRFDHEARLVRVEMPTDDPKKTERQWRIAWDPSLIFPRMAEGDKVRVQTSKGERGEILDRNGKELAVNGKALQLGIVPGQLGEAEDATIAKLAELLNIEPADIRKKLEAKWVKPELFVPIAMTPDDDPNPFAELPGVQFQSKSVRLYPYGEAAAHLTGYVGEISAEELKKRKDQGYQSGDPIGKAGLEQVFEERLRGQGGVRITIADADGREKAVLAEKSAEPGDTIKLTVDADLQERVYAELKADEASAAAIQPLSGEILALVSSPSYDPNAFVRGLSAEQYAAWNDDPRHPFLNRFTKAYAPGSAFKVATAAIGLDLGKLDPDENRTIEGLTWTKDKSWGSYYVKRVHAVNPVNLAKALIYSDNIYFAQTAVQVGAEAFAAEAAKFGIGEALPLPYPFKASQLANKGIRGEVQLADTGYGQGELTMTSLHVALVFSALVNGGNIPYPLLTEEDADQPARLWREGAMKPETAELLKKDLLQAVSTPGGVGHGAYIQGASIAGKTGTAEIKLTKDGPGTENGWFVGFDAANPELLLSVMVENVKGRGGSAYVTPKVKHVFEQYKPG
ncbi:penicillin-binding transpeptidase domain-containing protein [Cohnella sp. REN36]|uniref:penicillin-binding transpeptidase domain-containing protein n=1 Tax=Cohnella sp. REN36 TaxID=2887347 RepID=UPI001D132E75|nr:penicillin-binding transpeptidase domain-containing protein [Cohnella sp. REN36]MCC3373278.1 penicillin-binding transpeptidase domain-containing protein [Cohnella sp. REN36]